MSVRLNYSNAFERIELFTVCFLTYMAMKFNVDARQFNFELKLH